MNHGKKEHMMKENGHKWRESSVNVVRKRVNIYKRTRKIEAYVLMLLRYIIEHGLTFIFFELPVL